MRRLPPLLLLAALLAQPTSASVAPAPGGDSPGPGRKALRVLYRPKTALVSHRGGTGPAGENPSGMAVEVLQTIAAREGLSLEWVPLDPASDVAGALRGGRGDVVGDWGVTEARSREFLFSDPYLEMPVSLFVRKEAERPRSGGDLAGLRVGVVGRNISDELLSGRPDVMLVRYASLYDALFALLSGKVDAVAHLAPVLWKEAEKAGVAGRIRAVEPPLGRSPRAFAFRKGDEALVARVNRALSGFVVTPEYRRIHDAWFGKPPSWWTPWRIVGVNAVILLALATAMWSWRYVSLLRANARVARSEAERERAMKYEEIARLAGGMAHNLNNLMMVICGYAEMMRKRMPEGDPNLPGVAEILEAGRRAAELTGRLTAYARHSPLFRRRMELDALLGEYEPTVRGEAGPAVEVRFRPGGGGVRVSVDPGLLEGVVREVVRNAREAMPGGGTLSVETGSVAVAEGDAGRPAGLEPGRYAVISFSDTGCGIDGDTLAHVFEPFRTTKGFGRGMGLPSAYGAVKQSGGYLFVEGAPGAGTKVSIWLPEAREGAQDQ